MTSSAGQNEPASSSSVDVIVPCYRYGRYLTQCVESVLTQSHESVRVLILDDASPDDTAAVGAALAEKDPRVSFVRHQTNKGHIATYNEGIEWVSADYMLLLSADDYLLPGAIARAVELLDNHPDVAFVFGRAIELTPDGLTTDTESIDGKAWRSSTRLLAGEEFIEICGSRNMVPTPTAFVRTSLQKKVGGYRTELPHAGDMEMWLRLAAHGSIGIVEEAQAVYRLHANNMSSAYYQQSRLPDLLQRKAAFDCFMQHYGHTLDRGEEIRLRTMQTYSRDAIGYASAAFNNGDIELSKQITSYALELWPNANRSLPWFKLSVKRRIGIKNWLALRRWYQTLVGESTESMQ